MKGIILAAGMGTRLRPLTYLLNKHLLPVYDKPMIFYPIETLKELGVTEILIVTPPKDLHLFANFLGDGSSLGLSLSYKVQPESGGVAQALALGEQFIGEEKQFAVILGDNIFECGVTIPEKCGIVVTKVLNPLGLGVYHNGKIVEKPKTFLSDLAQTGLYFYTPEIFKHLKVQKPSPRGELEITDLNNWCLEHLDTQIIEYTGFWADVGTFDSLLHAANWLQSKRQDAPRYP
jgi:glucose-1-phosphate thymidylyltransferase